jgi:hypothetical protein
VNISFAAWLTLPLTALLGLSDAWCDSGQMSVAEVRKAAEQDHVQAKAKLAGIGGTR